MPIEIELRKKWDEALANQIHTNGNLICINHFREEDYVCKYNKFTLKKNAIPSIFAPPKTFDSTDIASSNLVYCDVEIENQPDLETIRQTLQDKLSAAQCHHDEIEQKMIRDRILLEQTIQFQEEKIKTLSEELDALKNQLNMSDLARFALSDHSNDAKVSKSCKHLTNMTIKILIEFLNFQFVQAQRQKQILTCFAVGIDHRECYPPIVRNFVISLKNVSPAAYRFVRKEFGNRLPTVGTIQSWHAISDINAQPGILKQAIEMLKLKAAEKKIMNEKLVVAMKFDEVAIHKLVQCVNSEMIGYEYVPGMDRRSARIASQAIVFMISGHNAKIHIPVAYYFIASLESGAKNQLLEHVIRAVIECDVILTSISFDGHKTNPVICRLFGAELDVFSDSFEPSFEINNCRIRCVFDPSHIHKLVRSTFGSKGMLYNHEKKSIKWDYIKRLVQFKNKRNMTTSHKLTQAHIDYHSKPMKVILAVETLSASTANAMEYLMQQGHPEFKDAEATIEFIRTFDDLFNIFNSTTDSKENPLKNLMSRGNASLIFDRFEKATEYIKNLYIRNDSNKLIPICKSSFRTGFQGYIVSMRSLTDMYNELVVEKNALKFIATHTSLSQDHLEVFFGKIRSLCGSNNNPTCQQFNAAMRKLLANTSIQYSSEGNCTDVDPVMIYNPYSNISIITSRRPKSKIYTDVGISEEDIDMVFQELSTIQQTKSTHQLIDFSDMSTAHIARKIESSIENANKFPCDLCANIFEDNEKMPNAFMSSNFARNPCQSTFNICQSADHILKIDILKGQFTPNLIYQTIFSSLDINNFYVETSFIDHSTHKTDLIGYILHQYIRIKCNFIARTISFNEHERNMRHKLTRMVINYNQ